MPGWAAASGAALQAVLDELCQTYDFDANKASFFGNFNPALKVPATPASQSNPNLIPGNGPYPLPTNYLRMRKKTFQYWFNGMPFRLGSEDDDEFDASVQQIGIADLPRWYITDLSNPQAPTFYVYPPPNAAYAYQGRCTILMPAIGSNLTAANGWVAGNTPPESSAVIPWFPNTTYLRTRVAGELMRTTGDRRADRFLGKNNDGTGAQDILDRLLQAKDDTWSRAQRITLDERRFGKRYPNLPDTKNIFG